MIIPVLILGFLLRLINLNQSLWLDEAINVVFAQKLGLSDYLTRYLVADFHPPGWFLLLWVWGHLFGFSEISVRLPALIFGLITIYLTYKIGEDLFSKKIGILASLFLSLAPLHIYYSQESRPYSFAAFAAVLSTYLLIKLIKQSKFTLLFYSLSLTLLFSSDYLAYLILPVHFLYCTFHKNTLKFIYSLFFGFLVFSPWLMIFPEQIMNGQHTAIILKGWAEVVGSTGVREVGLLAVKILLGRISLDNRFIYAFAVFLVAFPYVLIFWKVLKDLSKQKIFLLLWILVPIAIAIIISFFIPVFSYFRFIFILPAFYLLLAVGLSEFKVPWRKYLITILVLFELLPSLTYLLNSSYHREDWKDAVKFINSADNDAVVLFENSEIIAPYIYYNKGNLKTIPALKKIPAINSFHITDLENLVGENKKIYLFEYLVEITDPNGLVEKELESLNYSNSQTHDFRGVGFIREYTK